MVTRETAQALAKTQPDLAMALMEEGNLSDYDYRSIYASYASGDWDGAMASLQGLEGARRQNALRGLLENLEGRPKEEILTNLPGLMEMFGDVETNSHGILEKLDGETVLALVEQYPKALEDAAGGWARRQAGFEAIRNCDCD